MRIQNIIFKKSFPIFISLLILFSFFGCVVATKPDVLKPTHDLVKRSFDSFQFQKTINSRDRVLIFGYQNLPKKKEDLFLTQGGATLNRKTFQYIRHGILNSITSRNLEVIDAVTSVNLKVNAESSDFVPFSDPILMERWDDLKRKYNFTKMILYKIEHYSSSVSSGQKPRREFVATVNVLSDDGTILDAGIVSGFEGPKSTGGISKGVEISNIHGKFRRTFNNAFRNRGRQIKKTYLVFNDLDENIKSSSSGFQQFGQNLDEGERNPPNEIIRIVEHGIRSGMTQVNSITMKEKMIPIYLRRSWMLKRSAFNSTPLLIKTNWKDFANELNAKTIVTYKFLATKSEYTKALENIGKDTDTEIILPVYVKIIDAERNGVLLFSGILEVSSGKKKAAETNLHKIYKEGMKFGHKISNLISPKISRNEKLAIINMAFLPTGEDTIDTLSKSLTSKDAAFEDGITSALANKYPRQIVEKGNGYSIRPSNEILDNIELNPLLFLNSAELIRQGVNKILFYYYVKPSGADGGFGGGSSEKGLGLTEMGLKLVDVNKNSVVGAWALSIKSK